MLLKSQKNRYGVAILTGEKRDINNRPAVQYLRRNLSPKALSFEVKFESFGSEYRTVPSTIIGFELN